MKTSWTLQDAKNKFSEVVNRALREGPQIVTRHGRPVVVIVSVEDYKKITNCSKGSLVKGREVVL